MTWPPRAEELREVARPKATFGKRQREQQKQEKARLKVERRQSRHAGGDEPSAAPPGATEAELVDALASLHRALESGEVTMQQFEERREFIRTQLEQLR